MRRIVLALVLIAGCSRHTFTDLGNGTAVPAKSIKKYAEEHGLSPEQARRAMLAEDEARKLQPPQ